ncbi:MAG TPA: HD domain-containing phosphohydrolase [Anaerolineaceae bacterium]|nr:HD domain-containing phosphohydrolase [Anaerolineaceae bacterium]
MDVNENHQHSPKNVIDNPYADGPIRILLIDDDEDDYILVREYLSAAGQNRYLLDWAKSYSLGVDQVYKDEHDIFLVDYLLGPQSGIELLETAITKGITTPIILLTGQGGYNIDVQAMKAGAADYLVKSEITPMLLERSIRYALERKRAEENLRSTEHKLRLITENTTDVICAYDKDRHLIYVNPAVSRLTGYSIEEIRERNFIPWFHPDDATRMIQKWVDVFQAEETSEDEFRLVTKQGQMKYCLSTWGPFRDENDRQIGVQLVFRDITRLKRAEMDAIRRLQFTEALTEIDRAIMSSMDLRVTLQVALEQIRSQLHVDAADVLQLETFTHMLKYVSGTGFLTAVIQQTAVRLGEGFAGRSALERRMLNVPAVTLDDHPSRKSMIGDESFLHYVVVPLIAKGEVKGVLELFHRERLNPSEEWMSFLNTLAGQIAIAIDNAELFKKIQQSSMELILAYDTTLEGWSQALDLRDRETEGHTQRVTEMTINLARSIGVSSSDLVHIRRGALLHDIGKMGIPDNILHKPGPLDEREWEFMRQHPVYAYDLLSPISYLRPALEIPYCHHEKWDASGYPRGLRAEEIPLSARIFAVVDVWDALTNDRPYRKAWSESKALQHIKDQSGSHFDPEVVDAFLQLIQQIHLIT